MSSITFLNQRCGICLETNGQPLIEHNQQFFHSGCLENRITINPNNIPTGHVNLPIELPWSQAGYQIESNTHSLTNHELRTINPSSRDWFSCLIVIGLFSVVYTLIVYFQPQNNVDNGGGWG